MIIIAGGYDKNLPFDELGQKIAEKAKTAILIGQTASKISDAIRNATMSLRAKRSNLSERNIETHIVDSLAKAVKQAHQIAVPGDVVLLSPSCASYDMFDNFEHRGKEFINLVRTLGTKKAGV